MSSDDPPPLKKRKTTFEPLFATSSKPLRSIETHPTWVIPSFPETLKEQAKAWKPSVPSFTLPAALTEPSNASDTTPSKPKFKPKPLQPKALSEFRPIVPPRVSKPNGQSSNIVPLGNSLSASPSPARPAASPSPIFKMPKSISRISSANLEPVKGISITAFTDRFQSPARHTPGPGAPPKTPRRALFPPPPLPASGPSSSRKEVKAMNQTPLTTRLANVTAPHSLFDDVEDGPGDERSDSPYNKERTAISNQARAIAIKSEEKSLLSRLRNAGAGGGGDGKPIHQLLVGMSVSPEKAGHMGKRKGFVRNGLAERASQLISRAQNDTSLWTHEISRSLPPSSVSSSNKPPPKPPPADLRLTISAILSIPPFTALKSPFRSRAPILPPAYCLTRCQVDGEGHAMLVLFSFCSSGAPSISSPRGMEVGRTVLAWKPWIEVEWKDEESGGVVKAVMCSRYFVRNQ